MKFMFPLLQLFVDLLVAMRSVTLSSTEQKQDQQEALKRYLGRTYSSTKSMLRGEGGNLKYQVELKGA